MKFDLGITPDETGRDLVYVDNDSHNRIQFTISRSDKHIAEAKADISIVQRTE